MMVGFIPAKHATTGSGWRLGMASIQLRLNRIDAAEASFRRVLRLHPQDSYAAAQLAALQSGSDPVSAMSQVNNLIAREAGSADTGN